MAFYERNLLAGRTVSQLAGQAGLFRASHMQRVRVPVTRSDSWRARPPQGHGDRWGQICQLYQLAL